MFIHDSAQLFLQRVLSVYIPLTVCQNSHSSASLLIFGIIKLSNFFQFTSHKIPSHCMFLNFIFQLRFTFNIILYQLSVYSIVFRQSYTLQSDKLVIISHCVFILHYPDYLRMPSHMAIHYLCSLLGIAF